MCFDPHQRHFPLCAALIIIQRHNCNSESLRKQKKNKKHCTLRSCAASHPVPTLAPILACKLPTSLWTWRLLEAEAGLFSALKCFSHLCCLGLPLSEGHLMALRHPDFLRNHCFLCPCPVLAGLLAGCVGEWLATWQADRGFAPMCSSDLCGVSRSMPAFQQCQNLAAFLKCIFDSQKQRSDLGDWNKLQ